MALLRSASVRSRSNQQYGLTESAASHPPARVQPDPFTQTSARRCLVPWRPGVLGVTPILRRTGTVTPRTPRRQEEGGIASDPRKRTRACVRRPLEFWNPKLRHRAEPVRWGFHPISAFDRSNRFAPPSPGGRRVAGPSGLGSVASNINVHDPILQRIPGFTPCEPAPEGCRSPRWSTT